MATAAAPTALVATRLSGSVVRVSFSQTAATPAITNYKYSLNGGAYVALDPVDAASPIILNLPDGSDYSITLKAVNSDGDGTASSAVSLKATAVDMNSGKAPQPGGTPPLADAWQPSRRVPNIVGMTVTNGTAALVAAGFALGVNTGVSGTLNEILTQNPVAHALCAAGTAVNITRGDGS